MTLSQAVSVCFSKCFDFSGRATRSEFWWFYAFYFAVTVFMDVADSVTGNTFQFAMLSLFVSLTFTVPWITVTARRLHDIGKSGWWQLLIYFTIIPGLCLSFGFLLAPQVIIAPIEDVLLGIAALIFAFSGFILNVIWYIRPSQPGTNKWG